MGQTEAQQASAIVLIGPLCAGKSTVAGLLAAQLGVPHHSLDAVAWRYYEAAGWPRERFRAALQELGLYRVQQQFEPALAQAAERFLSEQRHGVIDLGAGHTHFEDERLFGRIEQVLAPFRHVVLLLPSPDLDESVRILKERNRARGEFSMGGWVDGDYDFIEHWVKDSCNHRLARHTVFTHGKTPEQTRDDVLALTGSAPG